jgi:Transglutaminase-like domain
MKKHLVFLSFFLFVFYAFSQRPNPRFASVDSLAKQIIYRGHLDSLTSALTKPYQEQILKGRAIFKWITENIRYDYKCYDKYTYAGKDPKTYKCSDDKECAPKKIAWEINYINKVLRKKKAVCAGYAMLFKKMCDLAGLRSEIISGYSRSEYYQVGTPGTLDHAWNALWIDSAYYLLDATWAAGGCTEDEDGKLLSFHMGFNDYYWLTPPLDFSRNHFPNNPKWSLLPNYTKENFAANPYYEPALISSLELLSPNSGIVHAGKGDTIHFKIDFLTKIHDLQINSNIFRNPDIWVEENVGRKKKIRRFDSLAFRKQQYISFQREGNIYEFDYIVSDPSLYYLDVLFDRVRIMRFKVVSTK